MKHCLKIIAIQFLTFLVILSLTGAILAQKKKQGQDDQTGKKMPDGSIIMPEGAPPQRQDKRPPERPPTNQFLVRIISIEVKKTPDGPTFVMKGVSEYPDGTKASVSIRFFEVIIPGTNRLVKIENGGFEVTFEASKLWKGKKFFPGNYEFEVTVKLGLQSRKLRREIFDKLGTDAGDAYRNKYVTVGKKEKMKQENGRFKERHVNAIQEADRLCRELDVKLKAASVKYTKKFYKLDKNGKLQIDPKNPNVYLVDMQKFLQHLQNNPNPHYDRQGQFKEHIWRSWLDNAWRPQWQDVFQEHQHLRKEYAAIPWPRQYDDMTAALKMLMKLSSQNSIQLYKWRNLPANIKDTDLDGPQKVDKRQILRCIKSVRFKLKLDEYLSRKQDTTERKESESLRQTPPTQPEKAKSDLMEPEAQRVPKPAGPQQPTHKRKAQSETEFGCYFLALLAIIIIALILKRKQ